jgi:hypothetical protein
MWASVGKRSAWLCLDDRTNNRAAALRGPFTGRG